MWAALLHHTAFQVAPGLSGEEKEGPGFSSQGGKELRCTRVILLSSDEMSFGAHKSPS